MKSFHACAQILKILQRFSDNCNQYTHWTEKFIHIHIPAQIHTSVGTFKPDV